MNHDVAVSTAREIADRVLAPAASQNDKQGRFSAEAVEALGKGGLLGLMLPIKFGGGALGPRTFAGVTATLAEADASAAMVYLMHVCAAATIVAARSEPAVAKTLEEIAAGQILATLAFSEAGSRSHFWAPIIACNPQRSECQTDREKIVGDKCRLRSLLRGELACSRRQGSN